MVARILIYEKRQYSAREFPGITLNENGMGHAMA
jgi:hypothetical protein